MNLLSVQSHVAYGHVGNSAAVFPLQRIGVEVWPVDTVQYSNHSGYGRWRGRIFSAAAVRAVIEGIEERGVLSRTAEEGSGEMLLVPAQEEFIKPGQVFRPRPIGK